MQRATVGQEQAKLDPSLVARVEALPERDVRYLSELMEKIYAGEIDRKDKILLSMTILAAPTTLVVGGIAYLINNLVDQFDNYLRDWRDLVVLLLLAALAGALWSLGRAVWFFNLLLSGENYSYMPYANAMLDKVLDLKSYLTANITADDGYLSWYAEAMRIPLFVEAATQNGVANEQRTAHRQGVFRNLFRAIAFSALTFVLIAVHHEVPGSVTIVQVWSYVHALFP